MNRRFVSSLLIGLGIISCTNDGQRSDVPESDTPFQIIRTHHMPLVENYDLLYIGDSISQTDITATLLRFKKKNCTKECNLNVFDTPEIEPLLGVYPLPDSKYLYYADHYIGQMTFGGDEFWWYPFQDIKYKELGGQNWRKPPIE